MEHKSRGALIFLYLLSQQGLTLLFVMLIMGYGCYSFYVSGEVPFGRGGHSIYFHKSSDPLLFWLIWLFFFACFLSLCAKVLSVRSCGVRCFLVSLKAHLAKLLLDLKSALSFLYKYVYQKASDNVIVQSVVLLKLTNCTKFGTFTSVK